MARKYGVQASRDVQRRVARLVGDLGVREAARSLGVGEESVTRLAAGGCVLPATLSVATSALAKLPNNQRAGSNAA